jgi:Ca2+-binding EF-hand superfamily protein
MKLIFLSNNHISLKMDIEEISDKNGNVDSEKLVKWLTEGNQEEGETPETAQKIFSHIGFNPAKLMNARDFARRYMLVKMFMELDKDHNGFLDKSEIKECLNAEDENTNAFKDAFAKFDKNLDEKISIEEFLEALKD